jgi:hypothetical protein
MGDNKPQVVEAKAWGERGLNELVLNVIHQVPMVPAKTLHLFESIAQLDAVWTRLKGLPLTVVQACHDLIRLASCYFTPALIATV